jgi:hypothetical protein
MREADLLQYEAARESVDRLLRRARQWPRFSFIERRIADILKHHPDYKRGPIDALRLFKAYRLALRGLPR